MDSEALLGVVEFSEAVEFRVVEFSVELLVEGETVVVSVVLVVFGWNSLYTTVVVLVSTVDELSVVSSMLVASVVTVRSVVVSQLSIVTSMTSTLTKFSDVVLPT